MVGKEECADWAVPGVGGWVGVERGGAGGGGWRVKLNE